MRGHAYFNFAAFDAVAAHCRNVKKWHTHNPAEHDRETYPDIESWEGYASGDIDKCPAFDFHAAMRWDLARVAESQHLVLLPGWEQSSGARHERYVAEVSGSTIWLACMSMAVEGDDIVWYLEPDPEQVRITAPPVEVADEDFMRDLRAVSPVASPDDFTMQTGPYARGVDGHAVYAPDNRLGPQRIEGDDIEALEAVQIGEYSTKDSGARVAFDSGMVRDTDEGKPRYDLIPLYPLRRLAELYARGAKKYGEYNWQRANSDEELARFKASAFRHLVQWLDGDTDEDHGIAVAWNVFAFVWLERKLGA